ncbi:UPF0688 protein C1orf174 homolog [Narcine bancroftii]|uniref:UPF0688 protein C1orf174 homolog n=1 Tax=Narcine bancroftii TaxID=1343680 RepID=UPI003831424F
MRVVDVDKVLQEGSDWEGSSNHQPGMLGQEAGVSSRAWVATRVRFAGRLRSAASSNVVGLQPSLEGPSERRNFNKMKTKQVGVRRSARLRNKELCAAAANASKQDLDDGGSTPKTPRSSHEAGLPLNKSASSVSNHPSKKQKSERVHVETEDKTPFSEKELEDATVILPHKPSHKSLEQIEKPVIHKVCTEVIGEAQENQMPSTTSLELSGSEKHGERAAESEEMDSNAHLPLETSIKPVFENKEDIEKIENSRENDVERRDTMEIDEPPSTSFKGENSIFLDEDSKQPVGKFFGNVEIMQDLPQTVPLLDSVTRREYRRRHFIAKDEEGEEQEDNVTDKKKGEPRVPPSSENEVPVGTETQINPVLQNAPDMAEKCW